MAREKPTPDPALRSRHGSVATDNVLPPPQSLLKNGLGDAMQLSNSSSNFFSLRRSRGEKNAKPDVN
ncbi:hypothetical protein [Pseudooceanicola lipolyticus]|uniref:hypothetical protein n=1 Tax=Pseudooceanicola lipolyticus TaxID=2029104 RepID=UPI001054C37A|nr:hypothetical protein [Pseudooceanicola lipolyticus]